MSQPAPEDEPADTSRGRSLRSVVNACLVVAATVLIVSLLAGAWSFSNMTRARQDLVDDLDPSVAAAARLLASTGDQQSGVRGFTLTGEPDFLEPWNRGRAMAAHELDVLRRELVHHPPELRTVEGIEERLAAWQRGFAEPMIELASGGGQPTLDAYRQSRVAFEDMRSEIDQLVGELGRLRSESRGDLEDASRRLGLTLVVVGAVLAGLIAAVAVGLRRYVLGPVDDMVDDASRITAGELDHVPSISGLAELAELGRSLDHVRVELVEQIREIEAREVELTRSNSELEQFAYVASHDLQEPLRKVASFCQMLERRYKGQLDERADTYIAFAVDGATRMQELINDLLSFSRVGRTTERFEAVDLDEVLDAAVKNLESAIEDSGGTVLRAPLPTVHGDRSLLIALFQNLIGNGLKFRGADRPVIDIGVAEHDDEVEITVADNGIGIPPEYRDRIFVIFQRLHSREEYPGTGIGLSLCRKIVEFHGGRIEVDDVEGPGTTIRFTLHREASSDAAAPPQKVTTA